MPGPCVSVSSVLHFDIQVFQVHAAFCFGTATLNPHIPLPGLTEKSDGLILLIDFSLQRSGVSGLIGGRVQEKSSLGSFQGSA